MQNERTLREQIKADFGIDIPVTHGSGKQADPIFIAEHDAQKFAFYQSKLVGIICVTRNAQWRLLGKELHGDGGSVLEKFTIETIQLTEQEQISNVESFYFDVSAVSLDGKTSPVSGVVSPNESFFIPYEMGWLHLDGVTNNEVSAPGLGVSLAYNAPGIKATVYIYSKNLPVIPRDLSETIVQNEFIQANRDLLQNNPNVEAWPDPPTQNENLIRFYKTNAQGDGVTLVSLTTTDNNFVKIRLTWARDLLLDQIANHFVRCVLSYVGRGDSKELNSTTH